MDQGCRLRGRVDSHAQRYGDGAARRAGGERGPRYRGPPPRGRGRDHNEYRRGAPIPKVMYLSQQEISRLADSSGEEAVRCIDENMAGLLAAYKHPPNCSRPQTLKHLVKILFNLVHDQEPTVASRFLGQILSHEGEFSCFIFHLTRLIKEMPVEQRGYIRRENIQYLRYLLEVGEFSIVTIPSTVVTTFPVIPIESTIKSLHGQGERVDSLKVGIAKLRTVFTDAETQIFQARMPALNPDEEDMEQPPNHFTEIDILPSTEELSDCSKKPFLRPNKVRGRYDDWDHYLDVQFRLLREDFVAPLRNGMQAYYEGKPTTDVHIYYSVRVLDPVCLFQGVGFIIHFDPTVRALARVNWEHSKKLIFGSMLCLFKDDYKTMIFASVMKRNAKQLKNGYLTIKFEGEINGFEIDPSEEFTMVESTAYFEAYRHVLQGLKNMSARADSMPFKPYIVECQLKDVPPPSYIKTREHPVTFNLKETLGTTSAHAQVVVMDPCTWPNVKHTDLDESQLDAVKTALRQEISVIQGPPGTGKTYVGLKIVQAFLQNRVAWDPHRNSPILIVCYTNHALDQFLEGIKRCRISGREPNIVRIGGRCKTESLANCTLSNKVQNAYAAKAIPGHIYRNYTQARHEMLDEKSDIESQVENVGRLDGNIVSLSKLSTVIPPHLRLQLTHGIETEVGKEIEVWLGLWLPRLKQSEPFEEEYSEDEELEAALEASMADGGMEEHTQGEEDDVSDGYIEVDQEAQILEEERILEGEEIEFKDERQREDRAEQQRQPQPKRKKDTEWQVKPLSKRERKLDQGFQHRPMKVNDATKVSNLHELNVPDKWKLYHFWVQQYLIEKKRTLAGNAERYNLCCEMYNKQQQELYGFVMKGADVIGMTTTGAAKHHHIFQQVFPKIVVVEEAAEVFESHILTSLSPSVQQLILIGDHKQLRPKPNHFELEKKYAFAVSLFERLADNGIPFTTLQVQHRMRPEIAALVHPHIYDYLENHVSVLEYDHIMGVGRDIFFIDHSHPEDYHSNSEDTRSHSNSFEANYTVSLCRYLLKQGYKPSQITVLTMYKGQLLELKKRMTRNDFEGVRVSAVDDFQGEENDIILLSLVRSNSEGAIGFLSIQNRVCVSLSRARMGLYVIANLSMLQDKIRTVWPRIISDMERKRCIGRALPLYCQQHPDKKIFAEKAEDFSKCPEGGCQEQCTTRLQCGHTCRRLCHPSDREHKMYKCHSDCPRTLPCGHKCGRKCYECTDQCRPCKKPCHKAMPRCGHVLKLECHIDPRRTLCTHQCTKILPCGHLCQELCHEPCTLRCPVKVPKSLPCGHTVQDFCSRDPDKVICSEPCKCLLDCEHECAGSCGTCQQGRLHVRCKNKCDRQLVCGHICKFPCTPNCPPCMDECTNYCKHSKCPLRCYQPCAPCMEPCPWQCQHIRCTARCGEPCDRPPCNAACTKWLSCGHRCIGLCGEKCPHLCLECNRNEVLEVFFGTEEEDSQYIELEDCGHVFEVEGLDRWIETETEEENKVVQMKACPKCKTPIRRSLRYGNAIKQTLKDMEEIKKKLLVTDRHHLLAKIREIKRNTDFSVTVISEDLDRIKVNITPPTSQRLHPFHLSPHLVNAIENQLALLPCIAKLYSILSGIKSESCIFLDQQVKRKALQQSASLLHMFLMQEFLSSQQLADIQSELRRLTCLSKLCDLQYKLTTKSCSITSADQRQLACVAIQVLRSGDTEPKMTDTVLEQCVANLIKHFNQEYKINGLSDKERAEIVQAIGLAKGHWFKCRNGHFYCIADCGGAMEISKCPDCGEAIGGRDHTLLGDNQLAREMDAAQFPAWSDAANMANYQL